MILFLHFYFFKKSCCPSQFPFHALAEEMKREADGETSRQEQLERDARNAPPKVISFSGGTAAIVDEHGHVRAHNYFDKMHVDRLRLLSTAFDKKLAGMKTAILEALQAPD